MKRFRFARLAIAMLVVLGLVLAIAAMAANTGEQQTIQGMVEKGAKGISMVKTDDGQAVTILNKNMADMIGKKVKVTGTLTKNKKNQSIIVTHVEEVTE